MALNKQKALKIVNPLAGILLLSQAVGGMAHDVIPYEIFSRVHGPAGFAMTLVIVVHIVLNWSWFKTAFAKKRINT
jgi:hypothetical protein